MVSGTLLGVYTGINRKGFLSDIILAVSLLGVSLPTFVIGILFIYLFAVILGILPSFGRGEVVDLGFWATGFLTISGLKAIILPSVTLSLFQMTYIIRLVRAEMMEILQTDYIKFARARGINENSIKYKHALKNGLIPVITIAGINIGTLIAFSIITETVFQWPGMGFLFIQAVQFVDIPIMSAYLVFIAFVFVMINFIVDILYYFIDPELELKEMWQVVNKILINWNRIKDSDIYYSFIKSPTAIISSIILFIIFFCSFFVELITPYNPFDPSSLSLMDAFTPPSWSEDGLFKFILGTDGQGRDLLSTILYGSRISLIVGFSAIIFSLILGVGLGLTAGYFGGKYEMIVMRFTDVQLTVPSILMALLVDGIARGLISREMHDEMAIYVLIFAIGISEWPQFARVSRAATLVEKNKDYVSASTIIGVSNIIIMFKHILPNILRPVLVIGTIGLALAIIAESTLSFLGVGVPPTTPSLGTLIRLGNDFLFSGEWWITFFPAIFLVLLAFSINLLGDWMRDTLNPKLKK